MINIYRNENFSGFNVSTLEIHEHFSKCPIEKGAIRTFGLVNSQL